MRKEAESIRHLKLRLAEATETLEAIRAGAVDALVVHGPKGPQVFTLKGADHAYRLLVEAMNEGAVTLDRHGHILYSNTRLAEMLEAPLQQVLGAEFAAMLDDRERPAFAAYLRRARQSPATMETVLQPRHGKPLNVLLSSNPLPGAVKGVCMVVADITARTLAEDARREMARQVLQAQEQERQRVARELHDGINQLLSTTRYRAQLLASDNPAVNHGFRERVEEVTQLLERTMKEVRLISRNLRPSELDDLGLVPALHSLVDELAGRNGTCVQLTTPATLERLSPQLELTVYRIAQEALTNVEKHSGATKVSIHLEQKGNLLRLRVKDNG